MKKQCDICKLPFHTGLRIRVVRYEPKRLFGRWFNIPKPSKYYICTECQNMTDHIIRYYRRGKL